MAQAICGIVGVTVVACILYAINRRHRWMVENGFAEESRPSGGGPFFVMREFIEPSTENIRHVDEEQQHHAEREVPGEKPDDEGSRVKCADGRANRLSAPITAHGSEGLES
jgi:hypothetical protein